MQEPSFAKSEREEKDMNEKEQMETQKLVRLAAEGDKGALEQLLTGVQDLVFNLSLRMLGTIHDAEDASQEILIRVMTNLASFRGGECFYHLGIPHCGQSSEKLQKEYVCTASAELRILRRRYCERKRKGYTGLNDGGGP